MNIILSTGSKFGDEKTYYEFYFGKLSWAQKIAIEKFYLPGSSIYIQTT